MTVTIYHNPKCSKSRATLALIEENDISPHVVLYLENPPTADELKAILAQMGKAPADIIRKKEAAEEGVDVSLDDEALIAAMVANPRVIERPIVVANGKAAMGRPPESVLDIL